MATLFKVTPGSNVKIYAKSSFGVVGTIPIPEPVPFAIWSNWINPPTFDILNPANGNGVTISLTGNNTYIEPRNGIIDLGVTTRITAPLINQNIGGDLILTGCTSLTSLKITTTSSQYATQGPNVSAAWLGLSSINFNGLPNLNNITMDGPLLKNNYFTLSSATTFDYLSVCNLPNLERVSIRGTLAPLYFSNCPTLTSVRTFGPTGTAAYTDLIGPNLSLDLRPLVNLIDFNPIGSSSFKEINCQGLTALEVFGQTSSLGNNSTNIRSVNLQGCNNLRVFGLPARSSQAPPPGWNRSLAMPVLDLSNKPFLTFVNTYGNAQLSGLDLSNCVSLGSMNTLACSLTYLNITGCTQLRSFRAARNRLSEGLGVIGLSGLNAGADSEVRLVGINVNGLSGPQIDSYFTQLPAKPAEATGTWTVRIAGNPGLGSQTDSIATNKGWVIDTTTTT